MNPDTSRVITQEFQLAEAAEAACRLFIRREDLIHPVISGNKYRKLKYNLEAARLKGCDTLLTYGGAFSNHIAATACAARANGFSSIGVIRGEELCDKVDQNPTLRYAREQGMRLFFVSRSEFREMRTGDQGDLRGLFGEFYELPEGGTNELAVKGCEEILADDDQKYDYVTSAVGTGGTLSGLIRASCDGQMVLGFPALKENFLHDDIALHTTRKNWSLIRDYHFGGYARITEELVHFINRVKITHDILLDPVYTGKMVYGLADMLKKGYFRKGSEILVIHTGGLQGVEGMNRLLKKKQLPQILC
ncbi:1-aminocyclopropane-1-carboxylate deaminase/D-cysteine desulfhydrase [Robertkochia aurantiaca]|uniref:1-aminocyclopropane-1-carboxylate deaminase/D-cysteine desulfhydrase n=1 Tax=Robertkochia aurantiaca TaxID=2873700 RepID=UPI001CCC2AFD|nr:pyridoxal-phosphate dependent enzyme [Robertkochia sp. 3YJGBD-33]